MQFSGGDPRPIGYDKINDTWMTVSNFFPEKWRLSEIFTKKCPIFWHFWLIKPKKRMFHELSTIQVSFEQFTDFNGLLRGLLDKKLFLCTRETSRKPNAMETCFQIAEAQPMLLKYRASRKPWKVLFSMVEAQPMLLKQCLFLDYNTQWEK